MKKIIYVFAVILIFSCNKENITDNSASIDVKKSLIEENRGTTPSQYYCSEQQGGGPGKAYDYYDPNGYYWGTSNQTDNLDDLFYSLYFDTNASGSNSISVFFLYDVYGVDSNDHMSQTDCDRFHNEYICRIIEILDDNNVPYPYYSSFIEYKLKTEFDPGPNHKVWVAGDIFWN